MTEQTQSMAGARTLIVTGVIVLGLLAGFSWHRITQPEPSARLSNVLSESGSTLTVDDATTVAATPGFFSSGGEVTIKLPAAEESAVDGRRRVNLKFRAFGAPQLDKSFYN